MEWRDLMKLCKHYFYSYENVEISKELRAIEQR